MESKMIMNMNTYAKQYQRNKILTASPAELTLMLYDGAIKFSNIAIKAIEEKDYTTANINIKKTENIIAEFKRSLDHKYAVAKDYDDIYDNMLKGLLNANIYKSTEILNGVVSQLRYTRVAWKSVMIANGMKHITLDESEQKLLSEVEQAIPEDAKQA